MDRKLHLSEDISGKSLAGPSRSVLGGLTSSDKSLSEPGPSWRRPATRDPAMSGQGVLLRARERLRRFPELLAGCRDQAAAYGRCVAATTPELRQDGCWKEFEALKQCFTQAAKKTMK
ncbi:NADH dehydrogenase [ubiquinone] 1 alpha subcomplex assembly factor 8-like [Mauremys mutica]|uniref:NADH dehydrogenase [ubiquinone] 1 alpha subcomplex assembly factor 8-like n=1 Tax=Mauremys mutica TaxID=74926 RepID=UPI001D15698A|nr:NADH dehydrogenase [ubiquinone] 1 alpha subcomplex assembly factor 8-like [Mauremys mutica]